MYHRIILRILEQFGKDFRDPRILDLGCGTGSICFELRKLGFDVYGVDIEKQGVEDARQKFIDNTFEGDRIRWIPATKELFEIKSDYSLPFEDNFFDFIYAYQVFEHLSDINRVLQELDRVLKPEGFIFTEFPASYSIIEPHLKIPFVHWLPYSTFRAKYIYFLSKFGIGLYSTQYNAESLNENLRKGIFYKTHDRMDEILSMYFEVENIGYFRRRLVFDKYGVLTIGDLIRFFMHLKSECQMAEAALKRNYLVDLYIRIYAVLYSLFKNRSLVLKKRTVLE